MIVLRRSKLKHDFLSLFQEKHFKFKQCKGGIAIFVEQKHANNTVVLETGVENDEEFVVVKINTVSPPLVIMAIYGPQSNNKKAQIESLWSKYVGLWKKYTDLGWNLIIAGDLNAAIGNSCGLTNNDPSVNRAGELIIKAVQDLNLTVLNSMDKDDQRTHIDRSSDSSRCLDYVISNIPHKVKEFKLDNNYIATPYRVVMKKAEPNSRKFSDHKSLVALFELDPAEVKKTVQPTNVKR